MDHLVDTTVRSRKPVVDARQVGEHPAGYSRLLRDFTYGRFFCGFGAFEMSFGQAPFQAAAPVASGDDGDVGPAVLDR